MFTPFHLKCGGCPPLGAPYTNQSLIANSVSEKGKIRESNRFNSCFKSRIFLWSVLIFTATDLKLPFKNDLLPQHPGHYPMSFTRWIMSKEPEGIIESQLADLNP